MINQMAFVDLSVVEVITATISSTTSVPLLESSAHTPNPTPKILSEVEESEDLSVPTDPPSMFSTSMAPPRPFPRSQEEELITTVAPTIKEEHEDSDDTTDFVIDEFANENVTNEEFVPQRGDTFQEPQNITESTGATQSVSKPVEEPDDLSVIEINTVQPDLPMPDASLITEPMFAEGKTEEAVLDSGITGMASDLTDTPTELVEPTSEEVFSSSESILSTNYDFSIDEIATDFASEALSPTQPSHLSSSTSDGTSISDLTMAIPTDTTFMCNTQPGSEVVITTTAPPQTTSTATQTTPQMQDIETPAFVHKEETPSAATTATTILIDTGTSDEGVASSVSAHVFDESTAQLPDHSGNTLIEDATTTEMDSEFFTSAPKASAAAHMNTSPDAVVTDEQSIRLTIDVHKQNVSGKTYKQFLKLWKLHLTYLDSIQIFPCLALFRFSALH